MSELSKSEQHIAELAIAGKKNREIAEIRDTTEQVVKNAMGRIFLKQGITKRGDLRSTPGVESKTSMERTANE